MNRCAYRIFFLITLVFHHRRGEEQLVQMHHARRSIGVPRLPVFKGIVKCQCLSHDTSFYAGTKLFPLTPSPRKLLPPSD